MNYSIYQKTLNKLYKEVLRWITLENYQKAAEKLGIIVNKRIQLNKKEEVIFNDFNIYEEINPDKRVITIFAEEYKTDSESEKLLIDSMKNSHNSLYLIKEINPDTYYLTLEDLLNHKLQYRIIDKDLALNSKVNMLLFTRLINIANIYFTSELKLLFKARHKNKLLKECRKNSLLEAADTHRFINVFHLYRKYGIIL